jgi:Mg-chelatase subunit ChlD
MLIKKLKDASLKSDGTNKMEISTSYVNIVGVPQLLGLKIRGVQNANRLPAHFVLLLDTSGSMEMDGRLDSVKRCAKYLLNFLNESDRISIVQFADNASITVNCQRTSSENRMIIEGHINSLTSRGSTNLSAGLLKVRDILSSSPSELKTGLVILTDGYANQGIQDENGLRSLVSMIRQSSQNLSVSCVGYGLDHAGSLLRNIALEGGGSYNIVTSQEHVGPVFGEILGGLVSCVAQNVEITYPCDYENYSSYVSKEDGNYCKLFIGDVYSESETIVLLKRVGQNQNVTLKGFNCIGMEDISAALQWSITGSGNGEQGPYRMYYIRWSLSKILEKAIVSHMGHHDNLLSDIDVLERLLEGDGDMVALIRNEFVAARDMLRTRSDGYGTQNDTTILQRSMYLSSGRGAATLHTPAAPPHMRRVHRAFNSQDPAAPVGASPFMNATQRSISAAMSQLPGAP